MGIHGDVLENKVPVPPKQDLGICTLPYSFRSSENGSMLPKCLGVSVGRRNDEAQALPPKNYVNVKKSILVFEPSFLVYEIGS